LWHVDLDPVSEPEQPLGPVAVPDQRVEWAQQGAGGDPVAMPLPQQLFLPFCLICSR
jgi:hypothetical protein